MIIAENLQVKIKSSQEIYNIMKTIYDNRQEEEKHKEYSYIIGLDSQNKIKIIDLQGIGTVNACSYYVREVFKILLLKDCIGCILVHNHPSGGLQPSINDNIQVKEIKKAGEIFSINLLDSIIITEDNYFSYADNGLI